MCYMSDRERAPRVGVRELRQNLSVYLRRVEAGEALEVTEYGHPVARLMPLEARQLSPIQRMILEGRARPPRRDHRTLPAPVIVRGLRLSDTLREMRVEDDR